MKAYSFEIALLVRLKNAKPDEEVDKAFIDAIKRAAVKLDAVKDKNGFYVRFNSRTSSPPSKNTQRKDFG
jgi:hypothetical protein